MPVIKSIDLVGVSEDSWEDAARQALAEAAKTIRNITEMEVLHWTAVIDAGRIKEYHAHMRLNFRLER
ncbi:MAG TPA: dodecin family protein [Actinomycetota bacterium]|nr:dodecin family protein [Actinomycetota bacterium]